MRLTDIRFIHEEKFSIERRSNVANLSQVVKVTIFSPPLKHSGGVGTLYQYASDYFPNTIDVSFIDTRGEFPSPWFSVLSLSRAATILIKKKMLKDIDIAHFNLGSRGSSIRKFSLMVICKYVVRVPYTVQIHSGQFAIFYKKRNKFLQAIMKSLLNTSRKILILGEGWKAQYLELGFADSLLEIYQMGVPDLEKASFEFQPMSDKKGQNVTALFAAMLGSHKGLEELILSLTLPGLENLRLVVAGSGDIRPWVKIASENGVSARIFFVGLVPPAMIHEFMNLCEILVLPSRSEGLPVTILEGMSAGTVIVVTPVGSLPEFLHDGIDSVIIKSVTREDVNLALSRAVKLIASGEAEAMERNSRKLWNSYFDVESQTLKLANMWIENSRL